jgi:hypothetical protein
VKLPQAEKALVERKKVNEYLLNRNHPDNGGKADFFSRLGFSAQEWITFAAALRLLVITCDVTNIVESKHGTKYIVDGELENPRGRREQVRTVWIVDAVEPILRLVTAYLHEEQR